MNAILTRNKQNHTSICWEPFATSTPLKIPTPISLEAENVLRKQLQLNALLVGTGDKNQSDVTNSSIIQRKSPDSRHLPKRLRKNTSSANFDILTISSDEDESNENRKRPIIKLGSRKKTRSFLSNKKFGSEDTRIVNEINPTNEVTNCKKSKSKTDKRFISAVNDFGSAGGQFSSSTEKTQCPTERSQCSFSSDEENKIFGESKSDKNLLTSIKKLDSSKTQKTEVNDIPVKSVARDLFKGVKGSYKTNSENSKLIKTPKEKEITKTTCPVKKSRRKPPAEALQSVRNIESPLHTLQNKQNLSHQLFSESKEQEFINMLDLTKDETSDPAEVAKCSARRKENDVFVKPLVSAHPSIQNTSSNINKHERPKRTKQIPKEFWIPQNTPEKPVLNVGVKNQKQHRRKGNECNQQVQVLKGSEEPSTKNNSLQDSKGAEQTSVKRQKIVKKGKKKAGDTVQVESIKLENLSSAEVKLKNEAQNCLLSHPPPETHKTNNAESNRNAFANMEEGNTVGFGRPVFQRLNELSCKRNETGCSVEQCWNLRNFKCGVFMLKVNGQFACETLHKNSHLGGVLVKGALRMKIGDEDLDLTEGDMAFVPPLTKWKATNVGDCESVFYYWCGRFTG